MYRYSCFERFLDIVFWSAWAFIWVAVIVFFFFKVNLFKIVFE